MKTSARSRLFQRTLVAALVVLGATALAPTEALADVDVRFLGGFGRSRLTAEQLPSEAADHTMVASIGLDFGLPIPYLPLRTGVYLSSRNIDSTARVDFGYVDIPVLLRKTFLSLSDVRGYLDLGVAFAFVYSVTDGNDTDLDSEVHKRDILGVAAVGLDIGSWVFEYRYMHGGRTVIRGLPGVHLRARHLSIGYTS